jgi:hypothetical protein
MRDRSALSEIVLSRRVRPWRARARSHAKGDIWAEPADGTGTVVRFTMPA